MLFHIVNLLFCKVHNRPKRGPPWTATVTAVLARSRDQCPRHRLRAASETVSPGASDGPGMRPERPSWPCWWPAGPAGHKRPPGPQRAARVTRRAGAQRRTAQPLTWPPGGGYHRPRIMLR